MALKFEHARALRDELGVTRPIVVDSLDGACHRAYGSMPNMTWIVSRAGTPIYKSDWADVNSAENALVYFLDVAKRRRSRERLSPFRVERLDYGGSNIKVFYKGLERSCPKAVREFKVAGV